MPEEASLSDRARESAEREALESIARANGCLLFGVARLGETSRVSGDVHLAGLSTGICFGYKLSDVVLDEIVDHPTRTYQYHYRQVNLLLDHIGLLVASHIQSLGHRAFPVPSSQVVDWQGFVGHISHKAVGRLAGLGWIGRSSLLVNPAYGARVRYASVLTNLELPYDKPVEHDCGGCKRCVVACPGGAIAESSDNYDRDKCVDTIDILRKKENIGSRICGICVKVCTGNT